MIKRFEGTGRMSRVVVHNNTVYLCGQTFSEETCDTVLQSKEALKKVEALLEKYGSDKRHILSTTIYLRDIRDFSKMNSVWDSWIEDGYEPARACVEARLASPNIQVEFSVVAALKE